MNPVDTARHESSSAAWRIGASLAVALAIGVAALAALQPAPAQREAAAVSPRPQGLSPSPALHATRTRPVRFESNLGQAATGARFIAHGQDFSAQIFDDGVALRRTVRAQADPSSTIPSSAEARLRFVGARTPKAFDARERAEGTTNYMVGTDASKWLHDVPSYRQLRQPGLYPGIDLVYYGHDSAFEYDLVVQPGADASRIRIAVASGARPVIDAQGDLLLDGAGGSLRMHRPVLYQHIDGEKKVLDGAYVMLAANEVGFSLPAYDHSRPLIIDPTFKLLYSTYLGGVHDDQVGGMTLDAAGNAYVVGNSGSEDWPVSGNAFQTTRKAIGRYVRNVVVTKFDASGTLIYSTFIGGTTNDYGNSIAVDAAGRAYIAGATNSPDFPVTGGAFQSAFRGSQSAYLAVLSSDGASLAYSSLFGGDGGASARFVGLDAGGKIVIGGSAGTGLPATTGAYMTSLPVGNAAFVARFDIAAQGAAQLLAASYYGAAAPQTNFLAAGNYAFTLALDAAGAPWLTGQAYTTNLPVTANAVRPSPTAMTPSCSPGSVPLNSFAYVAHLSADLSSLLYASYLSGGNGGPTTCAEYGHGLAFDAAGNVYVGGSTSSLAFPTTAGTVQPVSPANSGFDGYSGFVTKLKPDGSAILWSTYLGGDRGRTYMSGLTADSSGGIWAYAGSAGGSNFPISADALQKTHGGGTFDASFTRLDAASGAMLYSTFMGGPGDDSANAFAVDATGNAYVAGATNSTNFPTTADAFQPALTANAYDGADWFFSILGSGTIGRVLPASGGNTGDVTLTVNGAGFSLDSTAQLVGATTVSSSFTALVGNGQTRFTFDLRGIAPGSYALVVTNPDGSSARKDAAFTVAAGGQPTLWATTIGRPAIRVGTSATMNVTYGNSGSVDAYFVPLTIVVPKDVAYDFPNGLYLSTDATARSIDFSGTGVEADDGYVYIHLIVRHLRAGETRRLPMTVTPSALGPVYVAAHLSPAYETARAPLLQALAGVVANPTVSAATCTFPAGRPSVRDCLGVTLSQLTADGVSLADSLSAPGTLDKVAFAKVIQAYVATDMQAGLDETGLQKSALALQASRAHAQSASTSRARPLTLFDLIKTLAEENPLFGWATKGAEAGFKNDQPWPKLEKNAIWGYQILLPCDCRTHRGRIEYGYKVGKHGSFTRLGATDVSCTKKGVLIVGSGLSPISTQVRALAVPSFRARPLAAAGGGSCPVVPPDDNSCPAEEEDEGSGGSGSGGGSCSGSQGSIDPNDKTGLAGDGSAVHYIGAVPSLSYTVFFENKPEATLPAANVVVTDQLDPAKVDLSTLTIGSIGFGSTTVAVPPNAGSFATMQAIDATMSVRIQGSLDAATGVLRWTFTTLDPATHLPPSDPTLGFLPPDTDGARGQGFVTFNVKPKSGLANGTTISNQAAVVFDANAPILTPVFTNTLDLTAPASRVQSIVPRPGTMSFEVNWSGTDTGSGIQRYSIGVSDNGGPFSVWQSNTTATTATYVGTSGHTYAFVATATDGAGNLEATKSAGEQSVSVNGTFPDPTVGTSGSSGGCTIGGDGQRDASLPLLVIIAGGLLLIARRRAATKRRREED